MGNVTRLGSKGAAIELSNKAQVTQTTIAAHVAASEKTGLQIWDTDFTGVHMDNVRAQEFRNCCRSKSTASMNACFVHFVPVGK